ncbi:hypothetical protein [Lysinibacillus sp. NPDC093688]|uniref:hypothetical protein n=1 Tax=Lysinibacillus sp. NPDC093688 TaxID=3390577 RepID=UPI003D08E8DD
MTIDEFRTSSGGKVVVTGKSRTTSGDKVDLPAISEKNFFTIASHSSCKTFEQGEQL